MEVSTNPATGIGHDLISTLRMLERAHADGTLIVRTESNEALFAMNRGLILSSHTQTGRRIGEELVTRGAIAPSTLANALSLQKRKLVPQPLGSLLVSLGVVTDIAAREVLEAQCVEALQECLGWAGLQLDFVYGHHPAPESVVHRGMSVEALLERVGASEAA